MNIGQFIETLAEMRMPAVFNPYADNCQDHDCVDAVRLRCHNLHAFLDAALERRVDTIWVARDLGYRGGRRTGIPLTDEIHLERVEKLFGGIKLKRATRGPIVAERTAAVVWKMLSQIGEPVVLWNVFPFHPHEPDDPLTNRCHTPAERNLTMPLLISLVEMFQARRIVAIGRDAHLALQDIGVPVSAVRHPSYGGQTEFMASIRNIYGVAERDNKNLEFVF